MEMIHTASLIHDDVLDEATLRRHLETINARWDNEASVLLGDYLFTLAISMVSSLDDTFAYRAISDAGRTMCEGELRQVGTRGNFRLGEAEYLEIIGAKTAALYACCCRLGAHYAGADEEVRERFGRFGHQLGVAFQIIDDVPRLGRRRGDGRQVAGHRPGEAEAHPAHHPAIGSGRGGRP